MERRDFLGFMQSLDKQNVKRVKEITIELRGIVQSNKLISKHLKGEKNERRNQ
jgi:hypothetical protein